MKPHKWAKEIKCFIVGGEVERKNINANDWLLIKDIGEFSIDYMDYRIKPQPKEDIIKMTCCFCGQVIPYNTYHACTTEHNVKPQPKEPQYLYAYKVNAKIVELYDELQMGWDGKMLLGKIKLEVDDER